MNATTEKRLFARFRTKLRCGRYVVPRGPRKDRDEYVRIFCKLNFLTHP